MVGISAQEAEESLEVEEPEGDATKKSEAEEIEAAIPEATALTTESPEKQSEQPTDAPEKSEEVLPEAAETQGAVHAAFEAAFEEMLSMTGVDLQWDWKSFMGMNAAQKKQYFESTVVNMLVKMPVEERSLLPSSMAHLASNVPMNPLMMQVLQDLMSKARSET